MVPVLDALVTWREAVVAGLHCSHTLQANTQTEALPSSRLTAKPVGDFVLPCCVPIDIEERVTVEGPGDTNAALTAQVTALRALSGAIRVTAAARIHSHVLISEQPGPDENRRSQSVLRWKVVASWD